jgi:5-methylcytosine-specific restriction endonuclease McrA
MRKTIDFAIDAVNKGSKRCSRCETVKPHSEFHVCNSKKDGRVSHCKVCVKNKQSLISGRRKETNAALREKYKSDNVVVIKTSNLKLCYKCRVEKPETKFCANRCNKSGLSSMCIDCMSIRTSHRRRAKDKNSYYISYSDWDSIKFSHDDLCIYCGGSEQLTKDHFVPISRGGGTNIDNIVPACVTCNQSKSDKDPWIWISAKFGVFHKLIRVYYA